jgi:hypothetical protein
LEEIRNAIGVSGVIADGILISFPLKHDMVPISREIPDVHSPPVLERRRRRLGRAIINTAGSDLALGGGDSRPSAAVHDVVNGVGDTGRDIGRTANPVR